MSSKTTLRLKDSESGKYIKTESPTDKRTSSLILSSFISLLKNALIFVLDASQ